MPSHCVIRQPYGAAIHKEGALRCWAGPNSISPHVLSEVKAVTRGTIGLTNAKEGAAMASPHFVILGTEDVNNNLIEGITRQPARKSFGRLHSDVGTIRQTMYKQYTSAFEMVLGF